MNYRGRCASRLKHFLRIYCGARGAESFEVVSDKEIYLYGKLLAIFDWSKEFGEGDVPIFHFQKDWSNSNWDHEQLTVDQTERRKEAIQRGLSFFEPREAKEIGIEVLLALIPDGYHQIRSRFESKTKYFVGMDQTIQHGSWQVFADADDKCYVWHRELGWLLYA